MARLYLDDPDDVLLAAGLLSAGAVVAHGFGNFCALSARGDSRSVRRVNELKGRAADQVGSITVPPAARPEPVRLGRAASRADPRADHRGPAQAGLPHLLTRTDGAGRTTQVISPGIACPANRFLELASTRRGPLYVTSASLSRHRTGAYDSPAHWRAGPLRADFAHMPDLVVLEHCDEPAARAAYPHHLPMSTSILAFHRAAEENGRPALVLDRHGSLAGHDVRAVLDRFGLGMVVGPRAVDRLEPRKYGALVGGRP